LPNRFNTPSHRLQDKMTSMPDPTKALGAMRATVMRTEEVLAAPEEHLENRANPALLLPWQGTGKAPQTLKAQQESEATPMDRLEEGMMQKSKGTRGALQEGEGSGCETRVLRAVAGRSCPWW